MYQTGSGQLVRTKDVTLRSSAAATATGNDTAVEVGAAGTIRLLFDVTAGAGTNPTLDVTVETSHDNGVTDPWRTLGTFTQATGVTSERKSFGGCDRFVRSRRVVGGTGSPSFTHSIAGETN